MSVENETIETVKIEINRETGDYKAEFDMVTVGTLKGVLIDLLKKLDQDEFTQDLEVNKEELQ